MAVVDGEDRGPSVHAALLLTGVMGGVLFSDLMIASAGVSDAVAEADGVSGLDKPVLDWAISQRSPGLDLEVTAFTNLGQTLPMVVIAAILTITLFLRYRRWTVWVVSVLAAVLWATSMGLSRVYLGHHWLTDVMFAWLSAWPGWRC